MSTYLEMGLALPCGCKLHRREAVTDFASSEQMANAMAILEYWRGSRVARHRCELMSGANRDGIGPRTATKEPA